jgi:hypothetical protein
MANLSPLGGLGWRNRASGDPEVVGLRETLKRDAGIQGLEIVDPSEPGFAERAAQLFYRDGFVLVKSALDGQRQEMIKRGCDTVIREMLARDPARLGNRGSHRYSFGSSAAFFGCAKEWSVLIDPPAVLAVVEAIFESPLFTCSGYGGDFVLPGCTHYQQLHRDMEDYLHDPSGRLDYRDLPCARVAVNYPMAVVPGSDAPAHTVFNGATRQIPGTQNSHQPIPSLEVSTPPWIPVACAGTDGPHREPPLALGGAEVDEADDDRPRPRGVRPAARREGVVSLTDFPLLNGLCTPE